MGLYQLARLHYCFSNEQMQSATVNFGYPKLLFILMYLIGFIAGINLISSYPFIDGASFFNFKCGYNNTLTFYSQPLVIKPSKAAIYWVYVTAIVTASWDICTLFLYLCKIRVLRRYKDAKSERGSGDHRWGRIVKILYRIIILTLFYQFTEIFVLLINIMLQIYHGDDTIIMKIAEDAVAAFVSLSFSTSMYLMMEHNGKQYRKFLKIIYQLKLHWICCKWRYIIPNQLQQLDKDVQKAIDASTQTTTNDVTGNADTVESDINTTIPGQDISSTQVQITVTKSLKE